MTCNNCIRGEVCRNRIDSIKHIEKICIHFMFFLKKENKQLKDWLERLEKEYEQTD